MRRESGACRDDDVGVVRSGGASSGAFGEPAEPPGGGEELRAGEEDGFSSFPRFRGFSGANVQQLSVLECGGVCCERQRRANRQERAVQGFSGSRWWCRRA